MAVVGKMLLQIEPQVLLCLPDIINLLKKKARAELWRDETSSGVFIIFPS